MVFIFFFLSALYYPLYPFTILLIHSTNKFFHRNIIYAFLLSLPAFSTYSFHHTQPPLPRFHFTFLPHMFCCLPYIPISTTYPPPDPHPCLHSLPFFIHLPSFWCFSSFPVHSASPLLPHLLIFFPHRFMHPTCPTPHLWYNHIMVRI